MHLPPKYAILIYELINSQTGSDFIIYLCLFRTKQNLTNIFSFFQMVQAIQVLRFHLLELEKVSISCIYS